MIPEVPVAVQVAKMRRIGEKQKKKKRKREKKRLNYDEENVPMSAEVYMDIGKRALSNSQYVVAMRFLEKASELGGHEKVCLFEPRAATLIKLAYYQDAIEEIAQLEDALADKGASLPMYALKLKISALWKGGDFENAAKLSARGMRVRRKPPYFADMYYTSLGTLEQCIGMSAGECLVELGPQIHALSRQRRKQAELDKDLKRRKRHQVKKSTIEELCRSERLERYNKSRQLYKAQLFLAGLSRDWEFIESLPDHPALPSANKHAALGVQRHVYRLSGDMTRRLSNLEEECPLYVIRHRREHKISPHLKARKEEFMERKLQETEAEVNNNFFRILAARESDDHKAVLDACESTRSFLEATPKRLLPEKAAYLAVLFHILGIIYLEMKVLRTMEKVVGPDAKERAKKQQVYTILRTGERVDPITQSSPMPFMNYEAKLDQAEQRMRTSRSRLERVCLLYEMAYSFSMMGRWEPCLQASRKAFSLARDIGHLVWAINAGVMLARAELHLNTRLEAKTTLKETTDLAVTLDDEDVLGFLQAVSEEVESPTAESLEDDRHAPETQLLRLMPTPELHAQCTRLLAHIDSVPPSARMPLRRRRIPTDSGHSHRKSNTAVLRKMT